MSDLRVKLILEAMDRLTAPIRRMADGFVKASIRMMEAAEKLRAKVIKIGEAAKKIGTELSVSLTAPITALGVAAVRQSASFEKLKASLETVTGSSKAANLAFNEILQFASTTPFALEEALGSFIKLKALGLDPSISSLKSFGNTASAMGKSLDQFIEAVADASTGEFERLKEFGIKAAVEGKKVTFTFQGQKTTIRNNAEEIQKYLKAIGDTQFAGAMDKQMRTMSGAFSNFGDSVSTSLAKVGDSIVENLDLKQFTLDVSESITKLADGFRSLPKGMQEFIIKAGLILAIVGPLIIFIAQFAIGIASMIYTFTLLAPALIAAATGFKLLGLAALKASIALFTTPIGWIILGVTALAAVAYLLIKNWDKVGTFFKGLWAGIKETFHEHVEYIKNLLSPLLEMIDTVRNGISSVRDYTINKVGGLFSDDDPAAGTTSTTETVSVLRQKVDTGGTLKIQIDAEGKPTTVLSKPNDKNMDYSVDTGLMMGAM